MKKDLLASRDKNWFTEQDFFLAKENNWGFMSLRIPKFQWSFQIEADRPLLTLHLAIYRKKGASDIMSLHQNKPTYFLSWGGSPLEYSLDQVSCTHGKSSLL
jgi:hypothetical protein